MDRLNLIFGLLKVYVSYHIGQVKIDFKTMIGKSG
jgi:hypothetical protein